MYGLQLRHVSVEPTEWEYCPTYIIFCQEVEGTKDFVIIEFEALCSLQDPEVVTVGRRLRDLLLGAPLLLVLAVRILAGDSRTSAAATVVAVGVIRVRRGVGVILRHAEVVAGHGDRGGGGGVLWW